jgi:hypothetical protein
MTTKCTKWSLNVPIDRKFYQMEKIYQHLPIEDPPKIYPKWDFWFENMPSGNPGLNVSRFAHTAANFCAGKNGLN